MREYMRQLTEQILSDNNINNVIRITKFKATYCRWKMFGPVTITYGMKTVNQMIDTGFVEYKTATFLWAGYREAMTIFSKPDHPTIKYRLRTSNITGKRAAWAIVLHECAHAIVPADAHGWEWRSIVKELQRNYPYKENKNDAQK